MNRINYRDRNREGTCCIVQDPVIAIPFWTFMGTTVGMFASLIPNNYYGLCRHEEGRTLIVHSNDNGILCVSEDMGQLAAEVGCMLKWQVIGAVVGGCIAYKIVEKIFSMNARKFRNNHSLDDAGKKV